MIGLLEAWRSGSLVQLRPAAATGFLTRLRRLRYPQGDHRRAHEHTAPQQAPAPQTINFPQWGHQPIGPWSTHPPSPPPPPNQQL